jgi:hypothetical protein
MILLSSGIGAIGAYTPLFYLVISFLNSFFFFLFFLSFSLSHIIPPQRRMTQTATGNAQICFLLSGIGNVFFRDPQLSVGIFFRAAARLLRHASHLQ